MSSPSSHQSSDGELSGENVKSRSAENDRKLEPEAKGANDAENGKDSASTNGHTDSKLPSKSSVRSLEEDDQDNSKIASSKSAAAKASKQKKKTHFDLVYEAIVALQDRTGSSQVAIAKYVISKYPELAGPDSTFRSRLGLVLKTALKHKRLVKLKASYKIHPHFGKLMKKKNSPKKPAKAQAAPVKKRKFPMEDTALHVEDKRLGLRSKVPPKPALPHVFRPAMSKCDGLEHDSMGLVPDLLQVYHFFRGDVHFWKDTDDSCLPFSLQHLIHAVAQMSMSKKTKIVPPLLTHLFVSTLQILLKAPSLPRELQKLAIGLSPTSWSEICLLYMDAMERYYTMPQSTLTGLHTDIRYLLGLSDDTVEPMTPMKGIAVESNGSQVLPAGYGGYLGNPRGSLAKAYTKLFKNDPWNLSPEEIVALLRALTDDALAHLPELGQDLERRQEEMQQLTRKKRAADSEFRKCQLAFEGPKSSDRKDHQKENKDDVPFKPSITQAKFAKAQRAQQRASDAYEKGVRTLLSRTEPVGMDRNFNAVYCFRHDPDNLYVEVQRSSNNANSHIVAPPRTTWHVINSKSLFDRYVESLDVRGRREKELLEELTGHSPQQSLRRYLFDDIKERNAIEAKKREVEDLERRLANAKFKCDEDEGRRSGRLAGRAESELVGLQGELESLQKAQQGHFKPDIDLEELTGLSLLRKLDSVGHRETRRAREKKKEGSSLECSRLWSTGNIDGTGLVGWIAADLLDLEERCEKLEPWERQDITRQTWICKLEDAVNKWNEYSLPMLGPAECFGETIHHVSSPCVPETPQKNASPGSEGVPVKRRKVESPASTTSLSAILSAIRQPLLDLEERIFELTGLAQAARDADEADDNMSEVGADDQEDAKILQQQAWKKVVNRLCSVPAKRHAMIRQLVVEAISAARKAQLGSVVAELRAALLLHHPNAASECKTAASKVLEKYGGYDEDDDEDEDDEAGANEETNRESEEPSILSAEALILNSSLDGQEDAGRVDWIQSVKSCKTISKLASLSVAFCRSASAKLQKLEEEHERLVENLDNWVEEERKSRRKRKNVSSEEVSSGDSTEVWTNVIFTNEFCMVKLEGSPWWPARKCIPKEDYMIESLKICNRALVSIVGEAMGLRVITIDDCIRPFTGKPIVEDNAKKYSKELRSQLDECMAMARRIVRGYEKAASK